MSRKNFLISGLIFIFIIILLISFWLILSERENMTGTDENQNQKQEEQNNTHFLKKVETVLYNQENTVKWDLDSKEIINLNNKNKINFEELEVDAFSIKDKTDEDKLYTFTTPFATYFNRENRFNLEGPVFINKGDYNLEAGNMIWYQNQDQVKGSRGIRIESEKIIMTGDKFESSLELENIKISGKKDQRAHLYWKENENEEDK